MPQSWNYVTGQNKKWAIWSPATGECFVKVAGVSYRVTGVWVKNRRQLARSYGGPRAARGKIWRILYSGRNKINCHLGGTVTVSRPGMIRDHTIVTQTRNVEGIAGAGIPATSKRPPVPEPAAQPVAAAPENNSPQPDDPIDTP